MYTINDINNTVLINKSKFITYLYNINNINEINDKLNKLKNDYNDATHICYAYVLPNSEKCSDDGEPSGTAGLPILNIIKKNNLTNTLAVVIRYFGGIKLGAGGLVRAYVNSAKEVIDKSEVFSVENHNIYSLEMDYSLYDPINYFLQKQDGRILDTKFDESIKIDYLSKSLDEESINEISKGKVKTILKGQEEVYIKIK